MSPSGVDAALGKRVPAHVNVIHDKTHALRELNAEIIQVGDSSGFFGVRPLVVEQRIRPFTYVNLSCCANTGWPGYYEIAKYHLRRNTNIRLLVVYVTPYTPPNLWAAGMRDELARYFHNPGSRGFDTLADYFPSIRYRELINGILLSGVQRKDEKGDITSELLGKIGVSSDDVDDFFNEAVSQGHSLKRIFEDGRGWLPYDAKEPIKKVHRAECGPVIVSSYWREDKYDQPLDYYIQLFNELATDFDVDVVFIFNPVVCDYGREASGIARDIERIDEEFDRVHFNYPYIQSAPVDWFSDIWHLKPERAELNSLRVADIVLNTLKKQDLRRR